MKARSFIAAIAALTVSILAMTAGDAFATKIVPIQGKYSKTRLATICAANDGISGSASNFSYSCTKGNVTVECDVYGNCIGYVFTSPGGVHARTNVEALLQQAAPATKELTSGAAGDVLTQQ